MNGSHEKKNLDSVQIVKDKLSIRNNFMKKEITIIKEINPIVRKVESMEIVDKQTMSDGVVLLSQLNKFNDRITTEKEKITKPLNEALREVRGRYKSVELTLEEAILTLKGKISSYQTEAVKKEQEEMQAIASKVVDGSLSVDKALTKMEDVVGVEEKVKTDEGSISFRDKKCVEVIEITMLPIEYHLANEVLIRAKMAEGIELPGCRYWTEQVVVNKRC